MFSSLSALFVFTSFLTLKAGSMYKSLLVALIGLFSNLAFADYRWYISEHQNGSLVKYHSIITPDPSNNSGPIPNALVLLSPYFSITSCGLYTGSTYQCRGSDSSVSYRFKNPDYVFGGSITDPCSVSPDAPSCTPPATCPDGSTAPNGDVSKCPLNCDILSGGGGPECDTEEPPNGYCSDTQTLIFDDCQLPLIFGEFCKNVF